MSDNEDLELQALQRQLDDAFETTRPRAGYEDELWSRMQARRPFRRRLAEFFGGLAGTMREVPSVPAAAVAVVLISAIGIGLIALSGIHLGGGGASTTAGSAPLKSEAGGSQYNAASFGRLPTPTLSQPVPATSNPTQPSNNTADQSSQPVLYLGPATLVWAGPRPSVLITSAPVYRFREPTEADAGQFDHLDFLGGDFADDVVECGFGNAFQPAAKQNSACAHHDEFTFAPRAKYRAQNQ